MALGRMTRRIGRLESVFNYLIDTVKGAGALCGFSRVILGGRVRSRGHAWFVIFTIYIDGTGYV